MSRYAVQMFSALTHKCLKTVVVEAESAEHAQRVANQQELNGHADLGWRVDEKNQVLG